MVGQLQFILLLRRHASKIELSNVSLYFWERRMFRQPFVFLRVYVLHKIFLRQIQNADPSVRSLKLVCGAYADQIFVSNADLSYSEAQANSPLCSKVKATLSKQSYEKLQLLSAAAEPALLILKENEDG